jgi:D-alanine-D-alanine ligase
MRVGLTYDLRSDYLREGYTEEETAEFDRESTVDAIEQALLQLGYTTDRIGNVKALIRRLAAGDRWDIVFNICEGMTGIGREAQVPAILDAYSIPYTFSDPLVLSLTLHKGMTKHVIRDHGIPTPDFQTILTEDDLRNITLPFPLFVKPVAEGTGKGIDARSKVTGFRELEILCLHLLEKFPLGLIAESFLPGREFTVGIAGTGPESVALGVLEVILNRQAEAHSYTYTNKEMCEELVEYRLASGEIASRCEKVALDAWKCLQCRDAGRVDLRLDPDGNPHFLEVNPLAGLHPEHSDLPILCNLKGIPYLRLMEMIMDSAKKRIRNEK